MTCNGCNSFLSLFHIKQWVDCMTALTVLTRHGDWCRLQTSTAHVHENTCKAATLLSSSEMYCSFRTRERCADCLLANILKAQTTHTYQTTLYYQHFIWVDFSSNYETPPKETFQLWPRKQCTHRSSCLLGSGGSMQRLGNQNFKNHKW
jgi:hypothetical protein